MLEVGKKYKDKETGEYINVLAVVDTTTWGKCFINECPDVIEGENEYIFPISVDNDVSNWEEVSEKEWLDLFEESEDEDDDEYEDEDDDDEYED